MESGKMFVLAAQLRFHVEHRMQVLGMFHVKHRAQGAMRRAKPGYGGSGGGLAAIMAVALVLACPSQGLAKAGQAGPNPDLRPQLVDHADNFAAGGTATRDFVYRWPAAVAAIPALAAQLAAEREQLLADQKSEWEASLKEFAGEDCAGCMTRDFQKTWQVVTNLPRFLSLSVDVYEYSGGAHGNYYTDALVWDRQAKAPIMPEDMFRSPAALQDALGAQWCKALKAERAKRLGPDFTDDGFFPCPPVSDLAVLLGSSDKRRFNRIGLIASPYVAGSYAEGSYEVTLPVTAKVLAAVKPEYAAAFARAK